MKVLVTGAKGMLGTDLMERLRSSHQPVGVDIGEFDILDARAVVEYVDGARPDWVVHCAAMTNVDGCEREPDKAHRVNAEGAGNIARACLNAGCRMALLSTDYVYDGRKGSEYNEDDPVGPLNEYGRSKLAGEAEVLAALPGALVIRTSWLFGKNGPNFIEAILAQVGKKDKLSVVADQVGSPTGTPDLADAVVRLIEAGGSGVVHVSNGGSCSWYEYAVKVLELAGVQGVKVRPITTEELARPALRPAYSVLSNDRYERITGHRLRRWDEAVKEYIGLRKGI